MVTDQQPQSELRDMVSRDHRVRAHAAFCILQRVSLPDMIDILGAGRIKWTSRRDRSRGMMVCPFHGDSHPSLSISLVDRVWLWKCHGCNEGGNVIQFYQKCTGKSYIDAIIDLCDTHDIDAREVRAHALTSSQVATVSRTWFPNYIAVVNKGRNLLNRGVCLEEINVIYSDLNRIVEEENESHLGAVSVRLDDLAEQHKEKSL